MRIGVLYIVGSFKSGGTETQLLELLRRLDRSTFEPFVLCFERKGGLLPEIERLGVEVRETGFRNVLSPRASLAFRAHAAWMRERNVRIIQGFLFHGSLYGAMLKARRPEARLILCEQAIYGPAGIRHRVGRRLYYLRADCVTANCEAVRRAVAARDGIPAERIRVIYGGVDTRRFAPRAMTRDPGAGPVVGCVGRLHPDKGQTLLAAAAPAILAAVPDARFWIVGEGPQRPQLEAAIAASGIGGNVTLLGDRRDVPDLIAGMDVVVLPSASEGFSNAALEGSACGRPVVASDAGGNPEIVLDGETGLVFRSGDAGALAAAIVELLRDPARARRMGEAGRRRVETVFPLEEMVHRHERLYEELLHGAAEAATVAREVS